MTVTSPSANGMAWHLLYVIKEHTEKKHSHRSLVIPWLSLGCSNVQLLYYNTKISDYFSFRIERKTFYFLTVEVQIDQMEN